MNLLQKIASRLHPVFWLMVIKITDPLEIANSFNNFFISIVQTYISSTENTVLDLINLRNSVKIKSEPSDMFSIPIMSEDQVLKFLGDLDETKTTGMDGVSAKLLKMAAHLLAKPLTNILNLGIKTNQFPTQWETGRVTPINKYCNRSDQKNFRPITIPCTFSKIRDRHVYDSVYNFLIKKSLLYLAQSVFRAIHFCETSLNRLVDMWTSNMEKDLLILDLRKRLTWSILTFSSRNCLYTNVTKTLLTG